MLHAFARTFQFGQPLPPELAAAAQPSALPPLTPAAYLVLRRSAAGFRTPAMLAGALARRGDDVALALDLVHQLERPGVVARRAETLERLRTVFAFDPDGYRQLANEPADRHPMICRTCGASAWDDENACAECVAARSGAHEQ